jgi:hypothetical protein
MCSPTYLDHNDLTSTSLPQGKLKLNRLKNFIKLYLELPHKAPPLFFLFILNYNDTTAPLQVPSNIAVSELISSKKRLDIRVYQL